MSVSYTHLDVYKRQPQSSHHCRPKKLCDGKCHSPPLLLQAWPWAPETPTSPSNRKEGGNEDGKDSDFPVVASFVPPNAEFESEFDGRP